MDQREKGSPWRIIGLLWVLIESNLVAGNIFGFASLFSVLPHYGVYQSACQISSEGAQSNHTGLSCDSQTGQYQFAFVLGLGFYNIPAVFVGMIGDRFGARSLRLIAIVFHLMGWLALGFVAPGMDWLIFVHTISISVSGICNLLSSMSIAAHFVETRGLVTALISGAQLCGCIWYSIFQILIRKGLVSLSTLAFIWALFAGIMLGSAILFFDWRFDALPSLLKPTVSRTDRPSESNVASRDSLARHVKDPLFIVVTLFLSFLLLAIGYLPVTWFPWLMYLTGNDVRRSDQYTFWYNMSAVLGFLIAPACGWIIDYKANRDSKQKIFNIALLQSLTWAITIALCIVCMFQSMMAATMAMIILLFSRTMLVSGSQALIITVFPPKYIGSLLGIMWTVAGLVSLGIKGLTSLAKHPTLYWRAWAVILSLSILMFGHLIQLWVLYYRSRKAHKQQARATPHAEEMQTFKGNEHL